MENCTEPTVRVPRFLLEPWMVVIEPGQFLMGSPATERQRSVNGTEGPQRLVTVSSGFAIGCFAVTRAEFELFVRESGYAIADELLTDEHGRWLVRERRSFRNPGFVQNNDHPVVGANFFDALAYVNWLSSQTGRAYRLPSEAEWEYAARAGTTSAFWWGDDITTDQANYDGDYRYADGPAGHRRGMTVPVNRFAPNPWGLHQVHGNVWEWCADCWVADYKDGPFDQLPRTFESDNRVLRGGSWLNGPWNLRSAMRLGDPADFRHPTFGFRVARDL